MCIPRYQVHVPLEVSAKFSNVFNKGVTAVDCHVPGTCLPGDVLKPVSIIAHTKFSMYASIGPW
jgi:hypothetical protein